MPVSFLSSAQSDNYAKYPTDLPSNIVDSLFFLDDHDLEWIASKRGDFSRLGYALQLTTVRFIGSFIVTAQVVSHRGKISLVLLGWF